MSMPLPAYQNLCPDLANLLAHYTSLANWLFNVLQRPEKPRAEELLPRFLTECTNQGVASNNYPFTAQDRGLEDLRTYLRAIQETRAEADIASMPTQQMAVPSPGQRTEVDEDLTEKLPVAKQSEKIPAEDVPGKRAQESDKTAQAGDQRGQDDSAATPAESDVRPTSIPSVQASGTGSATVGRVRQADKFRWSVAPLDMLQRARKRNLPPHTRRQRILSRGLLILILTMVLLPALFLITLGISAYTTYHTLGDEAHSAVSHLLDVKKVFAGSSTHPDSFFDPHKLQQARADFASSEQDFQQMQGQLQSSVTLKTIATFLPQYRTTLSSALAASVVGGDTAKIGQIAATNALQVAPTLSVGPLHSGTNQPFLTQPMLTMLGTTLDQVSPLLNTIKLEVPNISPDSLPISASEKVQFGQILQVLPQTLGDFGLVRKLFDNAGWLLGVDQPRTFLVQTMDRAELRGTGGFTGQYGELKIDAGQVAPFNLTDISLLEYTNTSVTQGQLAPAPYRSWWPFANWGLRDSNISADFPTSAQVALNLYQQETGHQVDGLISFTPVLIEHVLAVIGPLQVPGYNTTVTAQNLEDQLHYYQLDNGGIYKQFVVNQQNPPNVSTSARKQFTSYVATLFLRKVRSASPSQLLAITHQILADLKTRDLQIYFTDPGAEGALAQYADAGQLDRSTNHDGLYVVQENLSASKASQYVQTNMHDTVTLDNDGGATHQLQIRLVYNQAGPVYGYDTYYDYLRVYVPPDSHLLAGDGFSSGTPLCGGTYGSCPMTNVYPGGELTCPVGQYQPGASPPSLNGSNGGTWQPLQTLGGPTNVTSDEPGRAMYGGWVILPKNCTITITLSWYVPPMLSHGYSLLVQRQAGTFPALDLSIVPNAANCARLATTGLHFTGVLVEDHSFTPPERKATGQGCYPQSDV